MTLDPLQFVQIATWAVTGAGLALWLWSWLRTRDPVGKLRQGDCAVVLVFASILARTVTQEAALGVFDWAVMILGPIFIAAALWRLSRTGVDAPKGRN